MSEKLVAKSLLKEHVSVPVPYTSSVSIEHLGSTSFFRSMVQGYDEVYSFSRSLSGYPDAN